MAKPETPSYDWIAIRLESLRTTQSDGTSAFSMGAGDVNFDDMVSLIETYEVFDESVSDLQRSRLVRAALWAACKNGLITSHDLKRELSRQKTAYLKSDSIQYVCVTSISVNRPPDLTSKQFEGAKFSFLDDLPDRFTREGFRIHAALKPPKDFPSGFTKVLVAVDARSAADAYNAAINTLDYLRGIWNFVINRRFSRRWYSGPASPVNSVYLGPVHTLYLPGGEAASGLYWYEPNYPTEVKATAFEDWPAVKKHTQAIVARLSQHPYASFLRDVFIRYARSLDGTDHESSFLKFWSLLESLTAINEDQKFGYTELIKRAVFLSVLSVSMLGWMLSRASANPRTLASARMLAPRKPFDARRFDETPSRVRQPVGAERPAADHRGHYAIPRGTDQSHQESGGDRRGPVYRPQVSERTVPV